VTSVEVKQDFGFNILDSCHLLRAAYSLVTSATIKSVLYALDFVLPPTAERCEENEIEPALGEVFSGVSKLLNVSSDLNEHVSTAQLLTDCDAANKVRRTGSAGDNSDEGHQMRGFASSWYCGYPFSAAQCVRSHLEACSNGDMFERIEQLEEFVENTLLENSVQKKITDFFEKN
jgi:hypothetical protein